MLGFLSYPLLLPKFREIWLGFDEISETTILNSLSAYFELKDLASNKKVKMADLNKIVSEYRIELETMKYHILDRYGLEPFVLMRSALDSYYKNTDSEHLHFHLFTKVVKGPYFHDSESEAKLNLVYKKQKYRFRV